MEIVWERRIPLALEGEGYSNVESLVEAGNNCVIIAATTDWAMTAKIFKINSNGDVVWIFEKENLHSGYLQKLVKLNNGTYVFVGSKWHNDGQVQRQQPYLFCISEDGNEVWERIFPDDFARRPISAFVTDENTIVVTGITHQARFMLVIDENGDETAYQEYPPQTGRFNCNIRHGCQIEQDRYLLTGSIGSIPQNCRIVFFESNAQGD